MKQRESTYPSMCQCRLLIFLLCSTVYLLSNGVSVLAAGDLKYSIKWVDIIRGSDFTGFNIELQYDQSGSTRAIIIYDAGMPTETYYTANITTGTLKKDFAYPHHWEESSVVNLSVIVGDQLYIDRMKLEDFSIQGTAAYPACAVDISRYMNSTTSSTNNKSPTVTNQTQDMQQLSPDVNNPTNLETSNIGEDVKSVHLDDSSDASPPKIYLIGIVGFIIFSVITLVAVKRMRTRRERR